jgi:APA family basic amino acid/polyamine antiporter
MLVQNEAAHPGIAPEDTSFKRSLGLLDATMIVAGSMIGSGIFIVSADMLKDLGSAGWLIAAWLITGFMTLTAALSYGELSAMFPKAGGQYVYLKEAYNPLIGFLYGWSFFAVIQTGTIAAVGVAFSKFAAYLFPALSDTNYLIGAADGFHISAAQVVSILLIVLLTYINTRGVKEGKIIQTTFTLTKLIALFGLILFGFLLASKAGVWNSNWADAWSLKQHTSRIAGAGATDSWGRWPPLWLAPSLVPMPGTT